MFVWCRFFTGVLNDYQNHFFPNRLAGCSLWLFLCAQSTPPRGYFLLWRCSGPSSYGSLPFQASRPSSCLQERPPAPCWASVLNCQELFLSCSRTQIHLKWRKTAWWYVWSPVCLSTLRNSKCICGLPFWICPDCPSPLWIKCYQSIALFFLENHFVHLIWKGSVIDNRYCIPKSVSIMYCFGYCLFRKLTLHFFQRKIYT